jgi:hypothetical protein
VANTQLADILDLFSSTIDDYRLTAIYISSGSVAFGNFQEPWLLQSIVDFSPICTQTLNYDTGAQQFDTVLTVENQIMLVRIMQKYWGQKLVAQVAQMQNFLSDHDFQRHSESQNMQAKMQYYTSKVEEVDLELSRYAMRYNNWDAWNSQNFGQGTSTCNHSTCGYSY